MSEKRPDPAYDVYMSRGYQYRLASEIVPGDIILTLGGWYPVKRVTESGREPQPINGRHPILEFELINGEIHAAPATAFIAVVKGGPTKVLTLPAGVEVTWCRQTPPEE